MIRQTLEEIIVRIHEHNTNSCFEHFQIKPFCCVYKYCTIELWTRNKVRVVWFSWNKPQIRFRKKLWNIFELNSNNNVHPVGSLQQLTAIKETTGIDHNPGFPRPLTDLYGYRGGDYIGQSVCLTSGEILLGYKAVNNLC
jgi:hypothetical protein